ncbi:PilW family protein [Stenotrophomonas sp. HITSZ_GD]|uniref:PilW family protein n=1 Tax=Stenotrophomonas sp. HITSZ_GD TaxID=3037248 RepID=UPI00240DD182|nr:PilW family protein [Stenotrophomonas sp. HITSZ_GD]MDG2524562.1 PilW family protein [Stenotrophomonas sp. HITSZ_GD]
MSFAVARAAARGRRRQAGLSLIELMIAMVIGLVLILGLIQVFAASRQAYQLSQGIARNQENGRFAIDFLSRDLRMAGHTGCVNDQQLLAANAAGLPIGGNIRTLFLNEADRNSNTVANVPFPLRFDVAIQGFDAVGTEPGDSLAVSTTPAAGAAADWSPALPNALANLTPRPIRGSDIVMLRYFSAEETKIQGYTPGATPAVIYPDEGAAGSTRVATGGRGLYAVADCGGATVFQATAAPGNTGMNVDQSGLNLSSLSFVGSHDGAPAYSAGQASLFRAESVAYYVGLNADNVPSLYRARWRANPAGALAVDSEEMVEGVESLQLLYGQDSAALTSMPSGYINESYSAADIGDATNAARWRRIGSVQVGLIVRGGSERAASEQAEDGDMSVLAVSINPPADGHYRSVYETTVALRNRLFGN